jgi:hypothetical protein
VACRGEDEEEPVSQFKYSGGAMVAIIAAIAVVAVIALRFLGQNAALISAGVRVLGQVFIVVLVAAGIGVVAWQVQKRRRAGAVPEEPPPPVQAVSEQVPLQVAGEPVAALPPGRGDTHIHLHGVTPEVTAEAIRLAGRRTP